MPKNIFQNLEQKNSAKLNLKTSEHIRRNINETKGTLSFIGHIVELFIPQVLDVIVKWTGGRGTTDHTQATGGDDRPKYPNTNDY